MATSRSGKQPVNLSPGTQGSNDMAPTKQNKGEKTRRSWSFREEEILLASLKELVANGWKSDNGFRAGFMNKLEEAIRREYPNSDIRVNPHILSKITAWKKNYYLLQGILGRSGVGFNLKGDHMIECDDEQWHQIVKVDSNAKYMRTKQWPYWEEWKEIFGKDRANGTNAEDIMEAVNDLYARETRANFGDAGDNYSGSQDDIVQSDAAHAPLETDAADNSVMQGEKDPSPKRTRKKQKTSEGTNEIFELLKKINEDTNARLLNISTRIGYDVDLSKHRQEVYGILSRIPGLSIDQKFDVCESLVEKAERLDLFLGLPDDDRPAYVMRILREKWNN